MGERDWTRPTRDMSTMKGRSGITLRFACESLGLPVSGTKLRLAGRLLDAGLTSDQVEERYGWRARAATRTGATKYADALARAQSAPPLAMHCGWDEPHDEHVWFRQGAFARQCGGVSDTPEEKQP